MALMKEKLEKFVNKAACVKHGRKYRCVKPVSLLLAAMMLCGMTGCSKNEEHISEPESSLSGSQSIPSESSASESASSEQINSSAEFNFDEAVKNITLFGQKISLPCAWSDFGEDFSHDYEYVPSENDLLCDLLYKGKKIGCIVFGDCDIEDAEDAESKPVVCIIVGHHNYGYPYYDYELDLLNGKGYYSGLIELEIGGLSMSSTETEIRAILGEPGNFEEGVVHRHSLDYDYGNGYFYFYINDSEDRQGRIIEFFINVTVTE